MDEQLKSMVRDALIEHLLERAPDVNLRFMYGGTVFELERDNPKSRIGGVFAYANHVSRGFSNGASFGDPYDVLEGAGKLRRHIKLRALSDIGDKQCHNYLDLAIDRLKAKNRPSP
jgi:hypothetical protein